MHHKRGLLIAATAGILLGAPSMASANAGLPMIVLAWPGMGLMLIPIIVLEVIALGRMLGIPRRRTILVVTVSNVVSTVVGIPITWAILVALQFFVSPLILGLVFRGLGGGEIGSDSFLGRLIAVTFEAAWLVPRFEFRRWMIPTAMLVLLVPFFFASCFVEYHVTRLMMRDFKAGVVKNAVRRANLVSYALLVLVVLGVLAVSICRHARPDKPDDADTASASSSSDLPR